MAQTVSAPNSCARPCAATPQAGGFLRRSLALWHQRRALARLDDDALRDIGISRAEARREARRPAWDVPDHWLR
ncbi:DUF1127 domain-containing protein [Pukyongiella litopenaei]|uniref:DUF1127 domain-containing protein n=1 Tax=Pukyongiella litopenaei TaxID=2605946 RepID=A0A2S0MUE8_9RHOB|nr:DUF1127 domain-containing protein [Pukyongiella litopenaei]AVO39351.1 DUF1127 domain-containing protein [Pukyongiella litopenaei]